MTDHEGHVWTAVLHGAGHVRRGPVHRSCERSIRLRLNGKEVRFYLGDPPNNGRNGSRVSFKYEGQWWMITHGENGNERNPYEALSSLIEKTSLIAE